MIKSAPLHFEIKRNRRELILRQNVCLRLFLHWTDDDRGGVLTTFKYDSVDIFNLFDQ